MKTPSFDGAEKWSQDARPRVELAAVGYGIYPTTKVADSETCDRLLAPKVWLLPHTALLLLNPLDVLNVTDVTVCEVGPFLGVPLSGLSVRFLSKTLQTAQAAAVCRGYHRQGGQSEEVLDFDYVPDLSTAISGVALTKQGVAQGTHYDKDVLDFEFLLSGGVLGAVASKRTLSTGDWSWKLCDGDQMTGRVTDRTVHYPEPMEAPKLQLLPISANGGGLDHARAGEIELAPASSDGLISMLLLNIPQSPWRVKDAKYDPMGFAHLHATYSLLSVGNERQPAANVAIAGHTGKGTDPNMAPELGAIDPLDFFPPLRGYRFWKAGTVYCSTASFTLG